MFVSTGYAPDSCKKVQLDIRMCDRSSDRVVGAEDRYLGAAQQNAPVLRTSTRDRKPAAGRANRRSAFCDPQDGASPRLDGFYLKVDAEVGRKPAQRSARALTSPPVLLVERVVPEARKAHIDDGDRSSPGTAEGLELRARVLDADAQRTVAA